MAGFQGRCNTCMYWASEQESALSKECRINPPVITLVGMDAVSMWPVTDGETGWCGQWRTISASQYRSASTAPAAGAEVGAICSAGSIAGLSLCSAGGGKQGARRLPPTTTKKA